MLKLDVAEIAFIKKNIENGDMLIQNELLEELFLALDSWIIANGFDKNYDLTDEGRVVQRMYDNIYFNN